MRLGNKAKVWGRPEAGGDGAGGARVQRVFGPGKLAFVCGLHYPYERMGIGRLSTAVLGLAALSAGTGACTTTNPGMEKQLGQLRQDIAHLRNDNERMSERLTALEISSGRGGDHNTGASTEGDRPALHVVKLGPHSEEENIDKPQAAEPSGDASVVIQADGKQRGVIRQQNPAKQADSNAVAQASLDYDSAMTLVKQKHYDKAVEALAGFLVRYPFDARADNAMYWRGECFYAKGDYVRASDQFSGVIARYPSGNKVPDALLKLGLSQLKMGDKDKANATFAQLREAHPRSEASKKIPRE